MESILALLALGGTVAGVWVAWKSWRSPSRPVEGSQERFKADYAALRSQRAQLTIAAAALYPDVPRLPGGKILTTSLWTAAHPLPVASVACELTNAPGRERQELAGNDLSRFLPQRSDGNRFARHTDAMEALNRPNLFEDRPCYGVVEIDAGGSRLKLVRTTFFETLDFAEPLAVEAAGQFSRTGQLALKGLPLRKAAGSPVALPHFPYAGIATLTLIVDGDTAKFFLLRRHTQKVVGAGGQYHVIPSGIFQPSSWSPSSFTADSHLWSTIVRETVEELLGEDHAQGTGAVPIDVESRQPYSELTRSLNEGRSACFLLAAGVDPLSFGLEVLTVHVLRASDVPTLLPNIQEHTDEGQLTAHSFTNGSPEGFPFDNETVKGLVDQGILVASAEALLLLALEHRDYLLASVTQ